jgi:hypothetical protein
VRIIIYFKYPWTPEAKLRFTSLENALQSAGDMLKDGVEYARIVPTAK